jgi:hypothetical protein
MPEIYAMPESSPANSKLYRSDPDLPAPVSGVADVLQDGVEALLQVVDTKVNWVLPNTWVWIPGEYEWADTTEEGKSPYISTSYKLTLRDDNTCEYEWNRLEQTKKKTEHSMIMRGIWKQPQQCKIANSDVDADGAGQDENGDIDDAAAADADAAVDADADADADAELSHLTRVIDALVIVPNEMSFERHTTGSTGKTVTIATKPAKSTVGGGGGGGRRSSSAGGTQQQALGASASAGGAGGAGGAGPPRRRFLPVFTDTLAEWNMHKERMDSGDKDAEIYLGPFELLFEITPEGSLIRRDKQTAQELFSIGPNSIALCGITPKAVARLGEPHTIITDGWLPQPGGDHTLGNKQSALFSPLEWLAMYLKTHSPSYERHVGRQTDCRAWLSKAAATAKADEIAAELAAIAAALEAKRKSAHDWLIARAMAQIKKEEEEEEEDDEDDDE